MRIAVQTATLVNGDFGDQLFGYALLEVLPAAWPEAVFYYHDSPFAPGQNVEVVDRYQEVAAEVALSHFPEAYFQPIPEVLMVTKLDFLADLKPGWWPFAPDPKKALINRLEAANALLVPHTALRRHLVDLYGMAPEKIYVVGHGLPPEELRITPADSVTRRITRETYGNEHSYFLATATGHLSDNLERLFAAYDLFRQRCPEPVRLLVETAGNRLSQTVRKARDRAEYRADIVLLPALSPAERRKVVSSARALVHVSLATAFPLPVLDAWTAEVPCVSTDNAILQGAGTLVQGEDVKSIAEGLVSLVTTPFLASGLVENGKRRREDFSWERVAEHVVEVLRRVGP